VDAEETPNLVQGKLQNSIPDLMEENERLTLAYRDLKEIHENIAKKYHHVRELDLSNNSISDLQPLMEFTKLETLVVDNNFITHLSKIPKLPSLITLCINSNRISNLSAFIEKLVIATPKLKYLSMLNNEACPNFFNGGSLKHYKDYRHFVISQLKNLSHLDSSPITEEERVQARKYDLGEKFSQIESPKEVSIASPINTLGRPKNMKKKTKSIF